MDISKGSKGRKKLNAILIPITLLIFYLLYTLNNKDVDHKKQKVVSNANIDNSNKPTKIDAYIASEEYVKEKLISPASAEFAPYTPENIKQINDSTFSTISYVDSKNYFGTPLRKWYNCVVVIHKWNDSNSLVSLNFK